MKAKWLKHICEKLDRLCTAYEGTELGTMIHEATMILWDCWEIINDMEREEKIGQKKLL